MDTTRGLPQYKDADSHCKYKMVSWQYYRNNDTTYTWKDGLHIEMGPRELFQNHKQALDSKSS